MFELEEFTKATLTSVNPRAEFNGDDKKPAIDLRFSMRTSNTILSLFGSQLLSSTFWNNGEPAQQGDLIGGLSSAPNLRNPMIENVLKIKAEVVGAQVEIDHGTGGRSNIKIDGCTVKKFVAENLEGGTTILGFSVECHADEKTSGKLCMQVGQELDIKVLAPDTGQQELDGDQDDPSTSKQVDDLVKAGFVERGVAPEPKEKKRKSKAEKGVVMWPFPTGGAP